MALAAAGTVTSLVFTIVGGVLFTIGLAMWIRDLLPGRGTWQEPLAEASSRPRPAVATIGTVQQLREGMPGHRLRLPEKVHPISAGIKGGLVGGLIMPLPALAWGWLSGHGIWLPVNLLAGMVLPGVGDDRR